MSAWEPIDKADAIQIVGEGLHTGLRKGTDAPEAHALWLAVRDSDNAWSDALAFLIEGLDVMDLALCKKGSQ